MAIARGSQGNPQDMIYQQILGEFREITNEIAGLRVEMENFKQTLQPITRIISGDGVVISLSTQIEVLRTEMAHLKKVDEDQEHRIKVTEIDQIKLKERLDTGEQENNKGRWVVISSIITGVFGLIGSAIAIFMHLRK